MPESPAADAVEVHLRVLGQPHVVRARGNRAIELGSAVRAAWSWCVEAGPSSEAPELVEIVLDDSDLVISQAAAAGLAASASLPVLMDWLSQTITVRSIERLAGSALMLHACGLADRSSGGVVALVGPSGTGKTTLARTLATDLGYVSDETVVVAADRQVRAYPKPLSVLADSSSSVKEQMSPGELGLAQPSEGLHLAKIVLLSRDPEHQRDPVIEHVPTLEAIAHLAEQTSYLSRLPAPLHLMADLIHGTGGVVRVTYQDASTLSTLVHECAGGLR